MKKIGLGKSFLYFLIACFLPVKLGSYLIRKLSHKKAKKV